MHSSPFVKDIQKRDDSKMQHLFNESLIKVNSSTWEQLCVGDSFRHQGHELPSFFSAEDSDWEPQISPVWRSPLQLVSLISRGQHLNVPWPRNTADPANNVFGLCAPLDEQVLICAITATHTHWPITAVIWAWEGTTQTSREVLRPGYSSDRTSLWWPLDLCFVVSGQRLERWSCVSLSQTELYLMLGGAF